MSTYYITHKACVLHEMGADHPESPLRLNAIDDQLLASGIGDYLSYANAPKASQADLLRVHTPEYLAYLEKNVPQSGYTSLDADTLMNPHTLDAASYAAGSGILAVDLLMKKQAENVFCAVRPPGHHATANESMGFCFYNNLAVAVQYALEVYGLERVAIIDFDVHHGNGTEAIFAHDDRVQMCGFYQNNVFPFPQACLNPHTMHNIAMPAYANQQQVKAVIENEWLPVLHAHRPEMIFISAGFDAHREEELAAMQLVEADYRWITEQIVAIANTYAQGRIVSFLEGGYALSALARSVVAHLRVLADMNG